MSVFVLDKHGKPLMPCSEKRARLLLSRHRARVHRLVPFVIRLTDTRLQDVALQPLQVKLDPGSKTTGVAVVRVAEPVGMGRSVSVLFLMELIHRGRQISESLTARRAMRRRRRGQLRYRAPRFNNRTKPTGWLAPSLRHRVETTVNWVARLRRWAPVTGLVSELVRFDMQAMENPDIEGVEYQKGTLFGYEVREYLLEKWGRSCAYCSKKEVPLQIEHVVPKARSGSNRISNLTLACGPCNTRKGARSIEEFVKDSPTLKRILAKLKIPLRDAAAVNSTRWALLTELKNTGLPVESASGGRTKFNRSQLGIPKTHALDAVCVGKIDVVTDWQRPTLTITCMGRGTYQRAKLNRFGFPRGHSIREKRVKGFQTGDIVLAMVPASSKKAGRYIGRVAIRKTGSFNIQADGNVVDGISHKYCQLIQRGDGYRYHQSKTKIAI